MRLSAGMRVTIYDGTFYVATAHGREDEPETGYLPDNDFVTFWPKLVTCVSGANNHVTSVHIEILKSAPLAPPESGAVWSEGRGEVDGYPIKVLTMTTGEVHEALSPPFTGAVGIRVSCIGRAEAAQRANRNELFFEDVEKWKIHIWPLRDQ